VGNLRGEVIPQKMKIESVSIPIIIIINKLLLDLLDAMKYEI